MAEKFENLNDLIYPYVAKHFAVLQKQLPYLTGNLAYNATKLKRVDGGYEIGIDLTIAPYAEYLDRPDYRSYRYFDKAFETFYRNLKNDLENNLHWK